MGSVRVRTETGKLFIDFRYQGRRCREQTVLSDSAANRRRLRKLLEEVEQEIASGAFDYASRFPGSKNAQRFATASYLSSTQPSQAPITAQAVAPPIVFPETPFFKDFADTWKMECTPQWRPSHLEAVEGVLNKYLLPVFGELEVAVIKRADVLAFRAQLSKKQSRTGRRLGNNRINKIMTFLRQILNEAADRYEFPRAFQGIKPLKIPKAEVHPFTLDEVNLILEKVRPDYRNYMAVRFFSGLRSGELHGLRWQNIGFEAGLILVRETLVKGEVQSGGKTYESVRDVPMLPIVREALEAQKKITGGKYEWVFCNRNGSPIDTNNFVKRVWTPMLAYLDLPYRRPYQTRHTTATLMLAAGEAPEWIARVLGHTSTEMLFKTYSRFVPNLTRRDGSAMCRLLAERGPRFDSN
jgi:integrase